VEKNYVQILSRSGLPGSGLPGSGMIFFGYESESGSTISAQVGSGSESRKAKISLRKDEDKFMFRTIEFSFKMAEMEPTPEN
jgi:hypothetical protein